MKYTKILEKLILFTILTLPLLYIPGYGSFSALKYFFFGTSSLVIGYLTLNIWLTNTWIPKSLIRSKVSFGYILYFLAFFITTLTSANVFNSVWSSFQRTDGLLTMLFLTLFIAGYYTLVVTNHSEILKKSFISAIAGSVVLSMLLMFSVDGAGSLFWNAKGGSTMGNSSLAAIYVVWSMFFALYLLTNNGDLKTRIFLVGSLVIMCASPLFINWHFHPSTGWSNLVGAARAAIISGLIGLAIAGSSWLMFQQSKVKKNVGRLFLLIVISSTIYTWLVFLNPTSSLHKGFSAAAKETRFFFWDIAIQGFKDRPIFGWGPSNFSIVYHKYFDPGMSQSEYGGELWVDKTHNVFVESLVTGGILLLTAFLIYLSSLFYAVVKSGLAIKISYLQSSLMVGAIVAWIIQLLFVFDSISSLMILGVVTAMSYALSTDMSPIKNKSTKKHNSHLKLSYTAFAVLIFIFGIALPYKKNRLVYSANDTRLPARIKLWEKFDNISPMGTNYDSVLLFNNLFQNYEIRSSEIAKLDTNTRSIIFQELDTITEYLYNFTNTHPSNYELTLLGAQFGHYHLFLSNDSTEEKLKRAEQLADNIISLSPTNPQSYWIAAKIKNYLGKNDQSKELLEQAYNLAPKQAETHYIILELATATNDQKYYQESLIRAQKDVKNFKEKPRK